MRDGHRVTWVFEDNASGPLLKRSVESDVQVVLWVDGPEAHTRAVQLMQRAGMTPEQIGRIEIVQGDLAAVVEAIVRRSQ